MKTSFVDLRYSNREIDGIRILHRVKPKRMSKTEKRLPKRRQAVEPSISHLKADHRLRRNFLKGVRGDAMNPILAAAGINLRWLMRRIGPFWRWLWASIMDLFAPIKMEDRSAMASAAAYPKCSGTTS